MADDLTPAVIDHAGARYMKDHTGALIPIEVVKEQHKLEDQLVRSLFARAEAQAAQLADLKRQLFDDIDAFIALLSETYKVKVTAKGNRTFTRYDGLQKIQVQSADLFRIGPELQEAKGLIDELVGEWSADSRPELRAIIRTAFRVDHEGQVSRSEMLRLKRWEIQDPRWKMAMQAIDDAMRPDGTKRYIRLYSRTYPQAAWVPLSLDMATA